MDAPSCVHFSYLLSITQTHLFTFRTSSTYRRRSMASEGAAASSMGVHVKIQIHQRIVNNQSPNGQRPNIHSRPKDVGEKCAEVVTTIL